MITRSDKIDYLIIAVAVFFCFYFGLGSYALENMNEGLYGEIPREMLLSHNFIIPHLNFVPYLEKPPMLYWLIALSYKVFGVTEFAARFVPATAATSVIISVLRFCVRLKLHREGILAALILSTSVIFILLSRVLLFDMLLTAFFSASLLNFYLWYDLSQIKYLRFAYVFVALAVLTKGLFALVITPVIAIVFMLLNRTDAAKFWRFFDPIGILLFLTIAVPWHVAASMQLPDFSWQYFVNEHLYRFLDKRIPHDYHTKSWYFYLPMFAAYMLPWTLFLPALFKRLGKHQALVNFCWLWCLIPFVFFSISQAKGDYFVVMCAVPVALLLGLKLQSMNAKTVRILFFLMLAMLCGVLLIMSTPQLSATLSPKLQFEPFISSVARCVSIVLIAYGVVAGIFFHRIGNKFIFVAGLMIPMVVFLVIDKQHFESKHSEKEIAAVIQKIDNTRPVYLYRDFEDLSSLTFYLGRRVGIINSRSSDLYYGSHSEAAGNWFIKTIPVDTDNFIVAKVGHVGALKQHGYRLVYSTPNSALMTNTAK